MAGAADVREVRRTSSFGTDPARIGRDPGRRRWSGGKFGLFGAGGRLQRWRDQLDLHGEAVDVASFRLEPGATLAYADDTNGGRPPVDRVMMVEILVIQVHCTLFAARIEFLINGLYDPSATVVST